MDLRKEITLSDLVPKGLLPKGLVPRRGPKAHPPAARKHAPKELVGLKVGATGLKAALVANNGDKRLVRVASAPLAPGIVDAGEVRDPAALGEALSEFFAANGLPRRGVRLGLANSRIGVRTIEISGIDEEQQLENAIAFRVHEMLSVPLDEAVIDYQVLETSVDDDGAVTRKVLLVVAYRDSIDRYLAATDAAGISLAGIDLEAFALLRAVAEPREPASDGPALVAVSVGHERTTLAISDGSVCQSTRVLEWGGQALAAAIAHALKLSPSEGGELKRGLTFSGEGGSVAGLSQEDAAAAVQAARYELQTLARELLSSLRFYQAQPGSLAIGEIVLAGGVADIPGFAAALEHELGVRVTIADPLTRLELPDDVELPDDQGALAVAVGLGIED